MSREIAEGMIRKLGKKKDHISLEDCLKINNRRNLLDIKSGSKGRK